MSETADKNISRYEVGRYAARRDSGRFCLLSVMGYESDDPDVNQKIDSLLEELRGEFPGTVQSLECTVGGCDAVVTEDLRKASRTTTGECKAASYCLKEAFEAVKGEDGVEAGKARYRELMDTCEGASSKHSAGNFCPKLDCGLSAGVSIDMIPGTAGECVVEIRSPQAQLFDTNI